MSLSPINKRTNLLRLSDQLLAGLSAAGSTLISVVVPVCNERANLVRLHRNLARQFDRLHQYNWELILVNDGSTDQSDREIKKLVIADDRVKYIELSRNFGKEAAVTAGLNHSTGQAAIIMDADLQHPPHLLGRFIRLWQQGNDLVVGVRRDTSQSWLKNQTSRIFYRLISWLGDTPIKPNATDYRLLDRRVIEQFNRFTERNRITRGLIDWMGYRTAYLTFSPARRHAGRPSYSWRKLWHLATNTIVSHSVIPLKLAGYLGGLITLFSVVVGIFMFLSTYVFYEYFHLFFSGTAMLAVLNLFLAGITLSSLGLISLYIAHIQNEVINRPLYLVRQKYNFKD